LIYDGTSLRLSIFLSCMPPDEPKYFKEQWHTVKRAKAIKFGLNAQL
jgi:hypothetical protein